MQRKAICLLLIPLLLATACSRLTFVRPKMDRKDGEQIAQDYSVKDSPEIKRRQALQAALSRSVYWLQAGELDGAEKEARAALKLAPDSADATTMLAVIADRRGQQAQAGELYRRAAEVGQGQGAFQNNYGTWLCSNGHAAESLVWFDRAVRAPGYATPEAALANAGNCALSSGQVERAERDLRLALSRAPSNATALGAMAELEFRRQQYLSARAFVERRLAAAPASPAVLKLASQIEDRLGDKAAASRYVQRIRAEFPDAQDVNSGEMQGHDAIGSRGCVPPQGCGEALKVAREAAGLSVQEASTRLKMPVKVLQALEAGQWEQSGGAVFVRGQLRSYGRLLKVDVEPFLQRADAVVSRPAELVSHTHTPRVQYVFESFKRRAVYVVLTLVIATPVWMALRPSAGHGPDAATASLDVVPDSPRADHQGADASTVVTRPQAAPYVASLTPVPRATTAWLSLSFKGDSWVEVNAPDGRKVEHALLRAGEERRYAQGEVGRVKLGDATAVQVQQAGSTVDLTPYQRANVARFTVSSEGSLAPVVD